MAEELGPWEPLSPAAVAGLFGQLTTPWWIAGGWAIELYLGRPVRSHADTDVLLLRRDQRCVHKVLPGWDIQAADPPGSLRPWPAGETLPVEVHDIWCREHPGCPWRLQFMLDATDGEDWVSRRDARIRRPIASLGSRTREGIPILAPEIQLFYKAKGLRPKDQADFDAILPHLDAAAVRWLDSALALTTPDHRWRAALAAA